MASAVGLFVNRIGGPARLRTGLLSWSTLHWAKSNFSTPSLLFNDQDTPTARALKQPYPSTPLNLSLFEEASEDYMSSSLESSIDEPVTHIDSSGHLLARLVTEGDFASAERVRKELTAMGVDIPADALYERAAIHNLKEPDAELGYKSFIYWWSLVPEAHCIGKPRFFSHIRSLLLHQDSDEWVSLIMQFGTIGALKGYAPNISRYVIPHVLRHVDPSIGWAYFEEYERKAIKYADLHGDVYAWNAVRWRNLAIKSFCFAGKISSAIDLLQSSCLLGIKIPQRTYRILWNAVHKKGDVERAAKVAELWDTYVGGRHKLNILDALAPRVKRYSLFAPGQTRQMSSLSIATKLRTLKSSIVSDWPLDRGAVADFILAYRETGRSRALRMLQKKCFRRSLRLAALWVGGQMMTSAKLRKYQDVLDIFEQYFLIVGIPRQEITYRRVTQGRAENTRPLIPVGVYPPPIKFWPRSEDLALVWQALVKLARRDQNRIESLYRQLITQATASDFRLPLSAHPVSTESQISSNLQNEPRLISPPSVKPINAWFDPFINAFLTVAGPARVLEIFADMRNLGIAATSWNWTSVASTYARVGDVRRALAIFERMTSHIDASLDPSRGLLSGNEDEQDLREHIDGQNNKRSINDTFPMADVYTYTVIIKGFLSSHKVHAAQYVAQRLRKAGYSAGSNPYTDRILARLETRRNPN